MNDYHHKSNDCLISLYVKRGKKGRKFYYSNKTKIFSFFPIIRRGETNTKPKYRENKLFEVIEEPKSN
jgi:hypothetical protein